MAPSFQNKLLFGDRYAPTTRGVVFFDVRMDELLTELESWARQIARGGLVDVLRVPGKFEESLVALLPMTAAGERELLVSTKSSWNAYFNNHLLGTDGSAASSVLSKRLGCRSLYIRASDRLGPRDEANGYMPSLGGLDFKYMESGETRRYVGLLYDTKWQFTTIGRPLPCEDTDAYENPRVSKRLSFEQLCTVADWFGLHPFDEDFYLPAGTEAWLVARDSSKVRGSRYGWKRSPWNEFQ